MGVKLLGKKGIFLTFISIAIIAAAIVIFTPSDLNLKKDISVVTTRVSNINDYVIDLQNVYLERALHATGTKAIIALIKYMEAETIRTESEVFLDDFEEAFIEVLLDGNIGGIPIDDIIDPLDNEEDIMTDNTYRNWTDKINDTAYNVYYIQTYIGFDVDNVRVFQNDPWFVEVEVDLSFNVSSETASWNKTATIATEIEIDKFNDPYYLVKTSGLYVNKIRKSVTQFNQWDFDNVKIFLEGTGNYTHFEGSNAPSFIDRFTNNIVASACCGIESLVNPAHIAIPIKATSYVDYLYWETETPCDNTLLHSVTGLNDDFKLNLEGIGKYKLQDVNYLHCPPTVP